MSKHCSDSGKEKLPFNRKKLQTESGSGRGGAICRDRLGYEDRDMLISRYVTFSV